MATDDLIKQLYAHADEAEAFEHAVAESAAKPLRDQLQVISRWLAARWVQEFGSLESQANPDKLSPLLAELRDRLALIAFDPTQQLTYWAERARQLGIKQAIAELKLPFLELNDLTIGKESVLAIEKVATSVADRIVKAQRIANAIKAGNHADVMPVIAAAHRAVSDVELASRWVTNREVNNGSSQVASALNAGRMWVSERDACLHCVAYSGVVAELGQHFPSDLTFAAKPLKPWHGTLDQPPLHPHCRCRITPWLGSDTDFSLSDALKREAKRSVLKGWSLPSESENARLQAADRLLQQGANLPKSVEQTARRAVRQGHFRTRTVPNG